MILILDLDDTIFETKSMDMSVFDPAKALLEQYTLKKFGKEVSNQIIEEIKCFPFDVVADKYQFPDEIRKQFYDTIQTLNYSLSIKPFNDYSALKKLNHEMYLVTTGITQLQKAKIEALQISSDFKSILIDDPFDANRKKKRGLFQEILGTASPNDFWVIGDNPDSELKAGKYLKMNTVQRIKENQEVSHFSDYSIETFDELERVFKSVYYPKD